MPDDEIPKLADWLAEYRSRPEPVEVVVASFVPAEPAWPGQPRRHGSAEQVGIDIVRRSEPGPPVTPDCVSHYVMGVDADGLHLWDDWYDSEQAAREAISDGHYGAVIDCGATDAG